MTNETRTTEVTSSQSEPGRDQRIFSFKITQWIWLLFGLLEALIALRIVLKMIGANPESPIVAMIFGFTTLFLFPFEGLIGSPAAGGMLLELSSLFAMVIYGLIAWALERMAWLAFYRPSSPTVGTTQTTTNEHRSTP